VSLAGDWDMFLARDVLGYQVIAETWNHGRVLPEQIEETVTCLGPETWAQLSGLLRALASGEERPVGLEVGPAIVGSADPRLRFQDEESERVHAYWQPSLALAGAASLGQLVAHRRAEFRLASEDLEGLSLQEPGWLEALERDELDIRTTLPVLTLAELMQRLRVRASKRLGRLALTTIQAFAGGSGQVGESTAFARRRQGMQNSSSDTSPQEYVDAFLDELSTRH
jgi:hypothetical protein